MTLRAITCAQCGCVAHKEAGAISRAAGRNARMFCSRMCSSVAKRIARSDPEKRALKAAYDAEYRERNLARIRAAKAAAYKANPNRERERAYRAANMARHVKYCRRPEYRKWKVQYDRKYRAQREFGPFAEAALVILDLEREIASRASRYEIYTANGTLNKKLNRRREYETLCGQS